ncbi:MAG: transglutaminase family protein [bacterium]|nr:transglutaminase family protein [bacterium]
MWNRKPWTVTLLAFSILYSPFSICLAGSVDYQDPPQGQFFDDWSIIYLNGQKCGYSHTTLTRKGDVVKSSMLQTFRIGRAGQGVNATTFMSNEETVTGQPLTFTADMDMAMQKVRLQGSVRDGKVIVLSKQYGNALTETYDYPAGALMTWATMLHQEEMGYSAGTAYEMATYVPIMATNRAVAMKIKIEDPEEIEIDGKKRRAIRSTQEIAMPGMPAGMNSVVWLDPENHQPIKTQVPMMGMTMEMVVCSREEAVADFEAPEAFMTTLVQADKPIDHKSAKRIKMKLTITGDGPEFPPLPKTGMQTPSGATAKSVNLEVARQDHAALAKAKGVTKINPKALAEFIEPNVYINSDDPAVRKMADEAAGGVKAPYAVADRLRRYVGDKIADKNLNIGFASASEVCRNLSGDCSEHAVLLAALARAKGIPSRVACGLVYVPWFKGADKVFGFHMWTQVFINGQWVDMDAAQNETDCNPTHIALAVDSLQSSGLGDMAFAIFPVMARLHIEVLELDTR